MSLIALAAFASFRILAVDGMVIGERQGGKWVATDFEKSRPFGAEPLTWHPAGLAKAWGAPVTAGIVKETEGYEGLFLSWGVRGVHLAGAKPGRPRVIEALPTSNATYRGIVRRWLDKKSMRRSPVRITALFRSDLDGDGTKEILIEARSADDLPVVGFTRKENSRDYSLVLLRAVRGGKAVELPLGFSRSSGPQGSSGHSWIRAIADLDGDRRMEVVLSWRAWEVHGASVHAYRAGKTETILQGGSAL